MGSKNTKIWDIANDDLLDLSCYLSKIQATTLSTYSYLDSITTEPNNRTNNIFYMLDVIEELSNTADKMLSEIVDKLCAIYREMEKLK